MNQEKIHGILRGIQQKANAKFNKNLWTVKRGDKDVLKILDEGIRTSPDKWRRDLYEVMRRELDVEETVLNKEVGDAKDKFIDGEIDKEIKSGRIPPREEIKKYVQSISTTKMDSKVQS